MKSSNNLSSGIESNMFSDNIIQELCRKREVAIVEDDEELQLQYKDIFENYGCDPVFLSGIDDVKEIISLSNSPMLYILDVSLGQDRKTEGLDILEYVKNANSQNFVVIISTHIARYEDDIKKANMSFEKGTSLKSDIKKILISFLHRAHDSLNEIYTNENTNSLISPSFNSSNLDIYHKLLEDTHWIQQNHGKFIVIANGEFFIDDQLNFLLDFIEKKYPERQRFFAQIISKSEEPDLEAVDMSFSMSF